MFTKCSSNYEGSPHENKLLNSQITYIIIEDFLAKNEKDPAHRFRTALTFPYFSYKLSIIFAITAAMLNFLKILNMGFCCTIIGKFYVENGKDLPNRF